MRKTASIVLIWNRLAAQAERESIKYIRLIICKIVWVRCSIDDLRGNRVGTLCGA